MASVTKRYTQNAGPRWDVRYRDPTGRTVTKTFGVYRLAKDFASKVEVDKRSGTWSDPARGKMTLSEFARSYLTRFQIGPKTAETYEGQLRLHILPGLGHVQLRNLSQAAVTEWNDKLRRGDLHPNTAAKCYRLLRSMLSLAVQEGRIPSNPCSVPGAGREHIDERPIATVEQVFAIADLVHPIRRALVITAAFSQLRQGELLELRRRDINPLLGRFVVDKANVELRNGKVLAKSPKSYSGNRTVYMPAVPMLELQAHMERYVERDEEAFVFVGAKGGQLRRSVLHNDFDQAVKKLREDPANYNLRGLTFHDLRHTGATLMAQSGATLKELMARLGHSSPRAALIYQHATDDRDMRNAVAMNEMITKVRGSAKQVDDAGLAGSA